MAFKHITDKKVTLPGGELIPFRRYLTERCGLYFKDSDRKTLMDAISRRMSACGLSDPQEYFHHVTGYRQGEDEFRNLLNLLTVNHTFFFRNRSHFHALRNKILPEIIERKGKDPSTPKPTIRIWSAGCSTGEEPYTIAMIIRDVVRDLDKWEIEIFATDVSTEAIDMARTGVYRGSSVKHMDALYLNRYFVKMPGKESSFAIHDLLKQMVRFEYHNLLTDINPYGYDIIFCRNVFIYFHLKAMLEIVNRLYSSLSDPGYLFVGHSESLQFLASEFRIECWEGGIFYRKDTGGTKERSLTKSQSGLGPVEMENILRDRSMEELKAERRLKGEEAADTSKPMDERLIQIMECVQLKEYEKALSLIEASRENGETIVELRYLTAEIHANRSEFDIAVDELRSIHAEDPFFAPAHYLLGSIFLEKDEMEQARISLRKALYIDGDFAIARFLLGVVHKSEGRIEQALREFRNTLRCLDSCSPEDVIAYSGGFNASTLAGVCLENIERLRGES